MVCLHLELYFALVDSGDISHMDAQVTLKALFFNLCIVLLHSQYS